MANINVELSQIQLDALSYVANSPQEWAKNAVTVRADSAIDEIVDLTVKHCLDNGIQVPATREEIVAYAFDNGIVKTAEARQTEFEASRDEEI